MARGFNRQLRRWKLSLPLVVWATMLMSPAGLLSQGLGNGLATEQVVNVYSYRQPFLIEPLFERFEAQSGIEVRMVFARQGLIERLKQEGVNSPADLLLTADMSQLIAAVETNLTQAVTSEELSRVIPHFDRDPEGHWFGLTLRARVIVASRERIPEGEVSSYADLAQPRFRGRICTRSGSHPYQIALLASRLAHYGMPATRDWLAALKDNLARVPQGNDRAQIRAIASGICDLALVNSYYLALMLADPGQSRHANLVYMIFPDQFGHGTHVNLSAIAMTAHAPHPQAAQELMEFLVQQESQQFYAQSNHEYPVREGVDSPALLAQPFRRDTLPWVAIAAHRGEALRLTYEIGYDW